MTTFAAVMTGKGSGAIATIELAGRSAEKTIKKIFKPLNQKPVTLKTGKILVGHIADTDKTIDQVTVACHSDKNFAINCHGNPLIVEIIMELLEKNSVKTVSAEQLKIKTLSKQKNISDIEIETKIALVNAKTLLGSKIIANQAKTGLTKKTHEWLKNKDEYSLEQIKTQATEILAKSDIANSIIFGCTAVLAGPPNSGKSTLLNTLAGKQKAIVTDIKGTTTDWVSATCKAGQLNIEFIDTAGLAHPKDAIDKKSQQKTKHLLTNADLVLLVLDANKPLKQLNEKIVEKIKSKKTITVLNKSDLDRKLNSDKLPTHLKNTVQISAKTGQGTEELLKKIQNLLCADNFDTTEPICFTERQKKILKKISTAKSNQTLKAAIEQLLNAPVSV